MRFSKYKFSVHFTGPALIRMNLCGNILWSNTFPARSDWGRNGCDLTGILSNRQPCLFTTSTIRVLIFSLYWLPSLWVKYTSTHMLDCVRTCASVLALMSCSKACASSAVSLGTNVANVKVRSKCRARSWQHKNGTLKLTWEDVYWSHGNHVSDYASAGG